MGSGENNCQKASMLFARLQAEFYSLKPARS